MDNSFHVGIRIFFSVPRSLNTNNSFLYSKTVIKIYRFCYSYPIFVHIILTASDFNLLQFSLYVPCASIVRFSTLATCFGFLPLKSRQFISASVR